MKIEYINLNEVKLNPENPRTITRENQDKLINSLLVFPRMLEIRPIVIDDDNIVLGGNQRTEALREISKMEITTIRERLNGLNDFQKMNEMAKEAVIKHWKYWKENPTAPIIKASELTEEEKKQFIIKDNAPFGEWDWNALESWDAESLEDWGLEVPEDWEGDVEKEKSKTEQLSEIEYKGLYYEPKNIPNITLKECINLDKFNEKLKALDEYQLTQEQKETLKLFAYRFIKIDFEAVANYYTYNATSEEQKAIERLRLVLTDNGANGFIEDDMLSILKSDLNHIEEDEE